MPKSVTLLAVAFATLASSASSQANGVFRAPEQARSSGVRTGVQTSSIRRDTVQTTHVVPGHMGGVAVPVAVKLVPAVVMSDGTIMADFGFGLEPVRRACATVQRGGGRVIIGGGQVISRTPQTQPAPNQQTQSQQMSPSAPQRPLSNAALGSCFTRDQSGRVFITQ